MTEEEYDLCRDIYRLQVGAGATRTISERRMRLYVCACAQRVRHLLTRPVLLQAMDTVFRFADGLASKEELHEGWLATRKAMDRAPLHSKWQQALAILLYATTSTDSIMDTGMSAVSVCRAYDLDEYGRTSFSKDSEMYQREMIRRSTTSSSEGSDTYQREMARCCDLFRDLYPYPAPHQPSTPPAWAGGDVALVARAIYQENRFEDMPVLADALEDADCDRPELIAHCRQPGLHIRGCWAVDLILGLQ